MIDIRVLGERVLVVLPPEPEERTTASGLVLVRDPDRIKTPTSGIVTQLGTKSQHVDLDAVLSEVQTLIAACVRERSLANRTDLETLQEDIRALAPAAFDVQVGDQVLFSVASGEELILQGVHYVLLREDELLGVVEPKKEAAA